MLIIGLSLRFSVVDIYEIGKFVDLSRGKEYSWLVRVGHLNDRIPFTITFHPVNNSIKPIVNRNFKLLKSDSSTSNIFNQRPLFSLYIQYDLD